MASEEAVAELRNVAKAFPSDGHEHWVLLYRLAEERFSLNR